MSEPNNTPTLLGEALLEAIRQAVREEIRAALSQHAPRGQRSTEAPKPYLTIKEAADVARLSPSAIRLYVSKRQLKPYRVGRRVIIKRTDLEKFVESHPIEALPD